MNLDAFMILFSKVVLFKVEILFSEIFLFYCSISVAETISLKVYTFGKQSLLRFMFLQETSLFLKATRQTSAAKPQVFPSQHCLGNLMMGTCHQVSIKAVLVKDLFCSCLTLQNKWKASTSVQQKIKLTQQLPLLIFMFLVKREQYVVYFNKDHCSYECNLFCF